MGNTTNLVARGEYARVWCTCCKISSTTSNAFVLGHSSYTVLILQRGFEPQSLRTLFWLLANSHEEKTTHTVRPRLDLLALASEILCVGVSELRANTLSFSKPLCVFSRLSLVYLMWIGYIILLT